MFYLIHVGRWLLSNNNEKMYACAEMRRKRWWEEHIYLEEIPSTINTLPYFVHAFMPTYFKKV
jgi:hypothetical protein